MCCSCIGYSGIDGTDGGNFEATCRVERQHVAHCIVPGSGQVHSDSGRVVSLKLLSLKFSVLFHSLSVITSQKQFPLVYRSTNHMATSP
jgi:hypothetical protein